MKTNESKVSIAQSKSVSLRTTIPSNVAVQIGINAGDVVVWEMDKEGEVWIAKIRRKD